MKRRLLLITMAVPALAACGTTTTKTVTKTAPTPAPTQTTSSSVASTTPTATTVSTPTTTAVTTPATTNARVYFEGAVGGARQRPATLELTGDGTLYVSGVQWSSWGGAMATGSGNANYHGCDPNCAEATVHTALVSVHMEGIRSCSGRHYYSGVQLRLNSGQLLDKQFMQRSWSPC